MIKKLALALVCAAALPAIAQAQITVDGTLDAGYTHTATITYNPSAPNSNFGAPTSESAYVGYDIYLSAADGYVYGYLQANTAGGGSPVGAFANLYFNVAPGPYDGTEMGFELSQNTQNFFIAGRTNYGQMPDISVVQSADGTGLEFAIPNHYFTTALPFVTDYYRPPLATIGTEVTIGLSQSFGYSVAGGTGYGADRLGSVNLAGPVPEPAAWGMMIGGFALAGGALRRRRGNATLATA
jgi:hypothetical protein